MATKHTATQNITNTVDYNKLLIIGKDLLKAIGEDPDRAGLKDTPTRFANMWKEFIEYNAGKINTTFESITVNQMVIVSGIKIWTFCEHHLLPFWVKLDIGYIANDNVLGLSKFGRIAHKHAHRLQIQERLVNDIASELIGILNTENVAVLGKGEHLCMTMRGIKTPANMITSSLNGVFKENPQTRSEFLSLVK